MLSTTIVALLGVAVFALVIGRIVANQIEDQALQRARETAGIVARASFAPRLPAPGRRLAPADKADLGRQLAAAQAAEPGLQMRLWGANGALLYGRNKRGQSSSVTRTPPPAVRAALAGHPATDVHRHGAGDTSPGATLTAAVPVRRTAASAPAAALELQLPYAPTGRSCPSAHHVMSSACAVAANSWTIGSIPP